MQRDSALPRPRVDPVEHDQPSRCETACNRAVAAAGLGGGGCLDAGGGHPAVQAALVVDALGRPVQPDQAARTAAGGHRERALVLLADVHVDLALH